jgi:uncharacterized lipoprotein YddW (UPF0748 family)
MCATGSEAFANVKRILSVAALAATVFCGGGGGGGSAYQAPIPFQAEGIVRSARNLQNHAAVLGLVARAQANHVGTLVVAAKQDEDDEFPSGTVFYASAIAPQAYPGFDPLADVIAEAHRSGIRIKAWVPQFHDQVACLKDAAWPMQALVGGVAVPYTGRPAGSAYFVNPCSAAVQAYERSIVEEIVANYAIDGLVLDWVRFDDWNMDMSPGTRAAFQAATGEADPLTLDLATDNARRRAWQAWRTDQIAAHVQTLRARVNTLKPGLPMGIFILPPAFIEVGQDAAKFSGQVDFVCPMCYWADWGFTPAWVTDGVLKDTAAKVGPGVRIIPTLGIKHTDAEYRYVNANIRSQFPGITTLDYFGYLTWTAPDFQNMARWQGL